MQREVKRQGAFEKIQEMIARRGDVGLVERGGAGGNSLVLEEDCI